MAKDTIEKLPAESIVIMDRGYNDYELFMCLCGRGTRFVTRLKDNALTSALRSQKPNFWGDYQFTFTGLKVQEICGDTMFRCIQWHDIENDLWFDFLTNDFELPPETIAELYRSRWKIELFFKKLKQNLHIKSFHG